MKILNLKLFSVAIFIATIFATLPPYPVMAVGITTSTVSVVDKTPANVLSSPDAIAQIDKATKASKKYAQDNYINSDSVSIEVTTNAPAGLDISTTTLGNPVVVPPDMAVVCLVPLVWAVVKIVIIIVILGVTYYVITRVYKAFNCWASNINWHSTNETSSIIAHSKNAFADPQVGCLNTVVGCYPTNTFTFNLLSITNLLTTNVMSSVSITMNEAGDILPTYSDGWLVGSTNTEYSVSTYLPQAPVPMSFQNGSNAPTTTYTIYMTNTHSKPSEFFLQTTPTYDH